MKVNHEPSTPVYWMLLEQEEWRLHLAATEAGLAYVGSQDKSFEEMEEAVSRRLPRAEWIRDEDKLRPYAAAISAYLRGETRGFDLPHDFRGTPFQLAVWRALCEVPYGQTLSYSDIAHRIGKPAAVRAVGAAIGANPALITVPCHRVIGKGGALTGYRGGLAMKTRLLALERGRADAGRERNPVHA
ncbi:methylated-DNA--[protein]-cysteine S-methyltransferase [Cohnella nanjingensis]|uniref:methylated-DNA--[protein]-cysteine S-methyltransferase n=1 Tax=Cohnella nanjingensis TaxID=1387779 RepID=A0A7X0RNR1_9BACL|nr:methylated-DNA--[protein]-cysteine S-methyltransferase [Cohnella nanjingensis]MBB6669615.1 methylated-DNA--[protein]-cysteine S-methyltransferase [Cohnella nanjingensis]